MDAVLGEPKKSGSACFTCGDHMPANAVDPALQSHIVPVQADGTYVLVTGIGKTEHHLSNIGLVQRAGRVNRRLDGATSLKEIRAVLDALDEQEEEQAPLVLHLDRHGSAGAVPWPGIDGRSGNLLVQCKCCHDQQGVEASGPPEIETFVSSMTLDTESGDHWRALPPYTYRSFAVRSCCVASALTSEAVTAAVQEWKNPVPKDSCGTSLRHQILHMLLRERVARLTVTIQDKQLAQNYREGLRQLLGSMLDTLRNIAVIVLAALSHLTQAPPFLLVLLATIRHYGRRGDSDGHFLPAPALQGIPGWERSVWRRRSRLS